MRVRVTCRLASVAIVLLASMWAILACAAGKQEGLAKAEEEAKQQEEMCVPPNRLDLAGEWAMQSSFLEPGAGPNLSQPGFTATSWHRVQVPTTVLNALTKAGVYPDLRIGMNAYRIPDSSDDFNAQHDLVKFSHLPDKRNPWRDPWWFRRGFTVPQGPADRHVWLHFDSINYRAEVWLNGNKVADREQMVSMNQRFVFDVSRWAVAGSNCLAVKIWPVDHVGSPGPQLVPLAGNRFEDHVSDGPMDYAVQLAGGYDCFPSIPDRYMGILQDVWVEFSGLVTIRDPFVVTELPLPRIDSAKLKISATVVNACDRAISGILKGSIAETGLTFETPVTLSAGASKQVAFDPAPVMKNPALWWPNGYGTQPQYELSLQFVAGGSVSHAQTVRFGVRQITSEMHEHNGHHGRRIQINGQKIFARGGYIQPDALWDWTPGADRYGDPLLRPGEPESDLFRGHRQSTRLLFRCLRPLRRDDRPMLLRLFLDADRLEVSGRPSFSHQMLTGHSQALPQPSKPGHVHGEQRGVHA